MGLSMYNIAGMKKRKQLPLFSREFFAATGKQGGEQRTRNLSPAERKRIASVAARARWSKRKKDKSK